MILIYLRQIWPRFPLVPNMIDALKEILYVNRILIIFSRSKGRRVLRVSSEVTLLFVLYTLDDARVLCVDVEALSWLYFVLGDDDRWHLRCEATCVLTLGDRSALMALMASNKHIRSVNITTCRISLCLLYRRLGLLLTMILAVLIVSAVPHSLLSLDHLQSLLLFKCWWYRISKSYSLSCTCTGIVIIIGGNSILTQSLWILDCCLSLNIPILLMVILGGCLRYQAKDSLGRSNASLDLFFISLDQHHSIIHSVALIKRL